MPIIPEALLISAMLRTGDYTTPAARGVTSSMFTAHREEMKWMEAFSKKHLRLPSKVVFKQKFPEFTVYKVDDVEHYVVEVKQQAAKGQLLTSLDLALDLVDKDDIEKALRTLHRDLTAIRSMEHGESDDFELMDDWESTFADVQNRVDRVKRLGQAGVPTGFPTLDMNTGGLQPGWLFIVGARLGQGKTWTLIRMSWAAVAAGYSAAYFSLEQNRHQIAMRTHAFASSKYGKELFKSLDLMRGTNFDIKSYREFLEELRDKVGGAFYVNDTTRGRISPMTIAATIEKKQPDIVFIDYLTLLAMDGDDYKAVGRLSADVKSMSEQYQVPTVAAAQINRQAIGKEPPGAEHIALADQIGQDADGVITMKQQSQHVMRMRLAKFRHGPDGMMWYCKFSPGTGEFAEISGDEAAQQMELDREED